MNGVIQTIQSDARSRNIPVTWWIGPSALPVDLGIRLEKHGFTHEVCIPGMAVNLASLNESVPVPPGLSIQHAQDEASWRQWSLLTDFDPDAPAVKAWYFLLSRTNPATMRAYIGRQDGKPVAISLLFLAAGVAGIYVVYTLREARRKGIGAWMTLHPLLQARSMGFRIGILQSSEMGIGVYRSLGFQEYCKIDLYDWKPKS